MANIIIGNHACQFRHPKDGPCPNGREYYVLITEHRDGQPDIDIEAELCPLHAGSSSVQFHADYIERLDGGHDNICKKGKQRPPVG